MVASKVTSFKRGGKTIVLTLQDLGYKPSEVSLADRKEITAGARDLVQNNPNSAMLKKLINRSLERQETRIAYAEERRRKAKFKKRLNAADEYAKNNNLQKDYNSLSKEGMSLVRSMRRQLDKDYTSTDPVKRLQNQLNRSIDDGERETRLVMPLVKKLQKEKLIEVEMLDSGTFELRKTPKLEALQVERININPDFIPKGQMQLF